PFSRQKMARTGRITHGDTYLERRGRLGCRACRAGFMRAAGLAGAAGQAGGCGDARGFAKGAAVEYWRPVFVDDRSDDGGNRYPAALNLRVSAQQDTDFCTTPLFMRYTPAVSALCRCQCLRDRTAGNL